MRIIDADALKKDVKFLQDNTWPEDLSARMPRIIEEAETIPAIPVEWIFEQMQILHELHNKNEYVLQWLIEMWQKE